MSELLTLYLCPAYVIYCVFFMIFAVIIGSIFILDRKIVRGVAILLLAITIVALLPVVWWLFILGIFASFTISLLKN